jgi:hypothetical protein
LLTAHDYHLKKVIMSTKGGSIGGAYVKYHPFSSQARIPARYGECRISEYTVKDYVDTFNRFTTFLGEDLLIGDITHDQIEAFLFRSLF